MFPPGEPGFAEMPTKIRTRPEFLRTRHLNPLDGVQKVEMRGHRPRLRGKTDWKRAVTSSLARKSFSTFFDLECLVHDAREVQDPRKEITHSA